MSVIENVASNATKMAHVIADNPYYPVGSYIAGYAANEWGVPALLTVFFGACFVLFSATYFVAKHVQPNLSKKEIFTTMWFVLSGAIHIFFEGYYARNYLTLGAKQSLIGQMWKEYAFSDSRYLTNDAFVLCMETVTAFAWGPGCLIVAGLIITRHPLRFPLQLIVSLGQFYGDILYFATSFFDHHVLDITYYRPEPFYFWFYFFFMNFIWIVIPGLLIYQSVVVSASAISTVQKMQSTIIKKGQ